MKYFSSIIVAALMVSPLFAQYQRTVLLELSESTWIATNSNAICTKETAKSVYGTGLVTISYHWDDIINGGDPFYQPFAEQWAQTFNVTLWGRGAIDRVSYNGVKITSLDPYLWNDTIASRLDANRTTDGLVTLPEVLYDPNYDEIFVRTEVEFGTGSIENRELRFFLYLVQDAVLGPQVVDTASLGNCILFNDTIDTTYSFYHNDVAILNPSTYQGTDNIIPLQVAEGSSYTSMYTFDKPSGVSLSDLRVVAFVANYSNSDITKNQVVNSVQAYSFTNYDKDDTTDPNHPDNPDNPNSRLNPNNWNLSVDNTFNMDYTVNVFPNPTADFSSIEFEIPSLQQVSVDVCDMQGRKIMNIYEQPLADGKHRAVINTLNLESGNYLVRITGENFSNQTRLIVVH